MVKVLPGTTGRRRIYLMRHGHVDYNSPLVRKHRDPTIVELTETGEQEARAAGVALSEVHFDLAVNSGLVRTRQTLELVLSEHQNVPEMVTDSRFEELRSGQYIDFDSPEQLAAVLSFQYDMAGEPGATFLEGGETFEGARTRIMEGLNALLQRPDWASCLIVAHEGVNRVLLASVIGAPLGACGGFEQDTGCINIIDFDLVPSEDDSRLTLERSVIKSVNMTPANYLKNGMNLRSVEAIYTPIIED